MGVSLADYDYIIIGGGSAGCVLADKLTASGQHRVLLLEAGPSDMRFWVQVPVGYGILFHDRRVNWMYDGAAEAHLGGREIYHPRGKVLGGSSSINALVYHRGQAGDYDDWRAAGNPGWGYEDVEPVYDSFEGPQDPPDAPHLTITDPTAACHPIGSDFMAMCNEAQLPNSTEPRREGEGIATYLTTTRGGRRCSSAAAFLRPARRRPNLDVFTGAAVQRILFEGKQARSVVFRRKGVETTVRASGEIILSAGAVGSPQLLQLSGVGDAGSLQSFGIDMVHDAPAVGQNMQDHFGINYFYKANRPTLNDVFGRWSGRLAAGLQYLLTLGGPLSLSVNQYGGLVRTTPAEDRPDCQLYLNPLSYQSLYKGRRHLMRPDRFSGFIIGFNSCRPQSRGSITLESPDPATPPRIHVNYLDHPNDVEDALRMTRFVQRLQETPAIKALLAADPLTPLDRMDDDAVIDHFRGNAGSVFHLCGTCRMGPDKRNAVVDPRLRVHGVDGLRVVDASVFPNITSANTNAPTIMLAHRAAQMILADAR